MPYFTSGTDQNIKKKENIVNKNMKNKNRKHSKRNDVGVKNNEGAVNV